MEPQARFAPNRGNPESIELAASSKSRRTQGSTLLPRRRSNQSELLGHPLTFPVGDVNRIFHVN